MQESGPPHSPEHPSATGSWYRNAGKSGRDSGVQPDATPTVRTGSGSEQGPRADGGGSSFHQQRLSALLPVPGERLDSFELHEAIGVGGMGAVFRALDSRLDRFVALKVLPPEQAEDPENVQRFYQEGRAAARLDHENIARVYNIGHDKSLHYIAFEYIEGTTIRQRVERQGPLSVSETINFTLQIAGALVHASERGVVHRDIKPSNIIVTPQGRAKLVDMGLARRFERGGHDDGLTQSGMTLGTFDYISPEQARDPRSVDARSDLYSLGCTMYHMLTGQPPFPGGTVLQKLLSHQEDPAPDVRAINGGVPADLANVILKLMAKDPDRRYQAPEQLVRDLLTLAGALGLRSLSPEGLVWLSASAPPSWERHLYWGLPAIALALVVAGLVWWGQDGYTVPPGGLPASSNLLVRPNPLDSPAGQEPTDRIAKATQPPLQVEPPPSGSTEPPENVEPAPILPREWRLAAGDDLRAALDSAPSGSTLILIENGPYELLPAEPGADPLQSDLNILAGPGVRPVVQPVGGLDDEQDEVAPLLRFEGARVAITGITFDLRPVGDHGIAPPSAIQATDTALRLQNCSIRRPSGGVVLGVTAALELNALPLTKGQRPQFPVLLSACHLDGGQVGILARGSVDLELKDCTIAGAEPAVWLQNDDLEGPVPAWLWMTHVSFLAGEEPVLRFEGTDAQVTLHDSLVAPPRDGSLAVLTALDDAQRLKWSGRGNLYSRVGTFLRASNQPSLRDFTSWAEGTDMRGEAGSLALADHIWNEADPAEALVRGALPSQAFRLSSRIASAASTSSIGTREGPFAPIQPPAAAVGIAAWMTTPTGVRVQAPNPENLAARSPTNEPPAMVFEPMDMDPDDPDEIDEPTLVEPRLAPTPTPTPEPREESHVSSPENLETRPEEPEPEQITPIVPTDSDPERPTPIRSAQEFRDALAQSDSLEIWVAANADLTLSSTEIRGPGRREIKAEPGPTRPRIRFRPSNDDLNRTTDWPVLFQIQSSGGGGRLQLKGIDLILQENDAPNMGRWAAFGMGDGTDLNLIDCTLTVEGDDRSAIVRVQASEEEAGAGVVATAPSAASVRFSNCLLRCGDDVVDVSAGRRVDLKINNVVIASQGSLLHGHGLPRGLEPVLLNLELDEATVLAEGGIVWLESAIGEPDLPIVSVVALDTTLSTAPDRGPLFRVDGQEDLEALRDRIRYNMHKVAYHDVDVYLRVQTDRPGAGSQNVDRDAWEIAVGDRDEAAYHGKVSFAEEFDPESFPWSIQLHHLSLDPESPAAFSGANLSLIPNMIAPNNDRSRALEGFQKFIQELDLRSPRELDFRD